jgi:hypothetical protein
VSIGLTAVTVTTTIARGRILWQQACSTDPRARGHSRRRGGQRCGCSHSPRADLPQLRSRGPRAQNSTRGWSALHLHQLRLALFTLWSRRRQAVRLPPGLPSEAVVLLIVVSGVALRGRVARGRIGLMLGIGGAISKDTEMGRLAGLRRIRREPTVSVSRPNDRAHLAAPTPGACASFDDMALASGW